MQRTWAEGNLRSANWCVGGVEGGVGLGLRVFITLQKCLIHVFN